MTDETLMTETASTPEGEASSEATETTTETVETTATEATETTEAETVDGPIEYTFELPEGVSMADETLEGLKTLAGDLKLDQDNANKVKDLGVEMLNKWNAAQEEAQAAMLKEWGEAAKADEDYGGAKFDENVAAAKTAMEKLVTANFIKPEFKQFLNDSGLGNHPEMIRLFWKLSDQVSDDGLVAGNPAPTPKSRAEVLFGQHS